MDVRAINMISSLAISYHLNMTLIRGDMEELPDFDLGIRREVKRPESKRVFIDRVYRLDPKNILCFISDYLETEYCVVWLPEADRIFADCILLGPFLTKHVDEKSFRKPIGSDGVSYESIQSLRNYYAMVPVIEDTVAFQESCYAIRQAMSRPDPEEPREDPPVSAETDLTTPEETDSLAQKENFRLENKLICFVAEGDTQSALLTLEKLLKLRQDPTVQRMPYATHAFLRRAAEGAGVPPCYLNPCRSRLLAEADLCTTPDQREELLRKMVIEYSTLVRNYAFQDYSPVIRSALRYIHFHLSDDLSLKILAEESFVNASYLSSLFKKEVGVTVTDYVNHLRIDRAKQLLRNTDYQIQNVAVDCGIYDVNYFRKVFKKIVGMTPTEYVESFHA